MKQLSRPLLTYRQLIEENDLTEDYMSFTYDADDDVQFEYDHFLKYNIDRED